MLTSEASYPQTRYARPFYLYLFSIYSRCPRTKNIVFNALWGAFCISLARIPKTLAKFPNSLASIPKTLVKFPWDRGGNNVSYPVQSEVHLPKLVVRIVITAAFFAPRAGD